MCPGPHLQGSRAAYCGGCGVGGRICGPFAGHASSLHELVDKGLEPSEDPSYYSDEEVDDVVDPSIAARVPVWHAPCHCADCLIVQDMFCVIGDVSCPTNPLQFSTAGSPHASKLSILSKCLGYYASSYCMFCLIPIYPCWFSQLWFLPTTKSIDWWLAIKCVLDLVPSPACGTHTIACTGRLGTLSFSDSLSFIFHAPF